MKALPPTAGKLKSDGEIDDKEVFCMLTQVQLDEAAADPPKPPEIHAGTLNAESIRGYREPRTILARRKSSSSTLLTSSRLDGSVAGT